MSALEHLVLTVPSSQQPLIGREAECAELGGLIARASSGHGDIVLLSGEAGVGKTRLLREVLAAGQIQVLQAACSPTATSAYGPIASVLRAYLRSNPLGLRDCGSLCDYLPLLLPELGTAPEPGDRQTLFESIRQALASVAIRRPTVVVLEDLHWADSATLELLYGLSTGLDSLPLLILCTYRSDEVSRDHPLRQLRANLRRIDGLVELSLRRLDHDEVRTLSERLLGRRISPVLANLIFSRTQGVPFFVEELCLGLASSGRLVEIAGELTVESDEPLGIPETVRDAVLLRTSRQTDQGRAALDAAAVCGLTFDLDLAAQLAGDDAGLAEAIEAGFIIESSPEQGSFRHALTRDALYGEILWNRRRALHRRLAELLERRAAPAADVAAHWLAARDEDRARTWLLRAAGDHLAVHAYRDATQTFKQLLEIWPDDVDEPGRLAVLAQLGECAQIASDLPTAIRSWRELATARQALGDVAGFAESNQRLAGAFELQGALERSLEARLAAASAWESLDRSTDAAVERLAAASLYQRMRNYDAALAIARPLAEESDSNGGPQIQARALSIKGTSLLQLGKASAAVQSLRTALEIALRNNLVRLASEVYFQLGFALQNAADYAESREVLQAAISFCQTRDAPEIATACEVCLAGTLLQSGQWNEAQAIAAEVASRDGVSMADRATALVVQAAVAGWRGEAREARPILAEALRCAWQAGHEIAVLLCNWTLAGLDEREGLIGSAEERCRYLLNNWARIDNPNIISNSLRWSVSFFARQGKAAEANAGTRELAKLATRVGTTESLADLAAAIGEIALLEGDAGRAVDQFEKALTLLREVDLPFERAQIQLRAGAAAAAAGGRDVAIQRISDAHRAASRIGALPLADEAARELARLGESAERHLGKRAGRRLASGGLTRRELEILQLLASGRTNREIAHDLFLSPRTVEMHVGHVLAKLDCRTRTEAVAKAGEMGLLG